MPVANIKHLKPGWENDKSYVYIGRNGQGLTSIFGNPFRSEDGDAIIKFEAWIRRRVDVDDDLRDQVKALRGKTLVCFCHPRPCHGDVLARLAEELHNERT